MPLLALFLWLFPQDVGVSLKITNSAATVTRGTGRPVSGSAFTGDVLLLEDGISAILLEDGISALLKE